MAAKKKPLWTNSTLIVFLMIVSLVVAIATLYSAFSNIESVTDKDKRKQKDFKDLLADIEIKQQQYPQTSPPDYTDMISRHDETTPDYFAPDFLFYPSPTIKAKRMPIEAYYLGKMDVDVVPDFDRITLNISLAEIGQPFTRTDPNSKRSEDYPHVDPQKVTIEVKPNYSKVWVQADPVGDNQWKYTDNEDMGQEVRSYAIRASAEFPDATSMPDDTDKTHFKDVEGRLVLLPTKIENTYTGEVKAVTKRKYEIVLQPDITNRNEANIKIVNRQVKDVAQTLTCQAGATLGKTPYTVISVVNIRGGKILMNSKGLMEQIIVEMEIYTSDAPSQPKTIKIECYNDVLSGNPLSNSEMIKGALSDFRIKAKALIPEKVDFNTRETGLVEKSLILAMNTTKQLQPSPTQILPQIVHEHTAPMGARKGEEMMVGEIKDVRVKPNETFIVHYTPADGYVRRDKKGSQNNKMLYFVQKYDTTKPNQHNNTVYGPYEIKIGAKAISHEAILEEISKDLDLKVASLKGDEQFPPKSDKPSKEQTPKDTKNNYQPAAYAQYNLGGIPNALGNFIIYSDLSATKPAVFYAPETPAPTTAKPTEKSADELAREEIIAALDETVIITGSSNFGVIAIAEAVDHLTSRWKGLKGDAEMDATMEDVEDVRFEMTLDNKTLTGREFLDKIVENLNAKLKQNGSNMEVSYEIGSKIVFKAQRK